MAATVGRGYRGGRYKRRSAGSRVVLYGLILAVTLWLVGPFVTSIPRESLEFTLGSMRKALS